MELSNFSQGKWLYEGAFYKVERRAEDVSNLFGRKKYFLSAYQAVIESAGMGVGFGGIGQHDSRAPQSGHNAPLNILAEQGIVPFTIFLLWVLWILRGLFKASIHTKEGIAVGLFSAYSAVLISNMAYDAMFSYDSMWIFLGISAVGAGVLNNRQKNKTLAVRYLKRGIVNKL